MKQYAPHFLVLIAVVVALLSLLGDESFAKLSQLRATIATQREKNDVLGGRVESLRKQVLELQTSDRELEKAARNELGMARSNEMIFLFEDSKRRSPN